MTLKTNEGLELRNWNRGTKRNATTHPDAGAADGYVRQRKVRAMHSYSLSRARLKTSSSRFSRDRVVRNDTDGSNQTIRRTNTRVTGASYTRDATSAPSRRKRTKAWFRLSAVNRLQRARASVPRRRSANRTYLFFCACGFVFF